MNPPRGALRQAKSCGADVFEALERAEKLYDVQLSSSGGCRPAGGSSRVLSRLNSTGGAASLPLIGTATDVSISTSKKVRCPAPHRDEEQTVSFTATPAVRTDMTQAFHGRRAPKTGADLLPFVCHAGQRLPDRRNHSPSRPDSNSIFDAAKHRPERGTQRRT